MRKTIFFIALFGLLVASSAQAAAPKPVAKPKVDAKQQLIINVLIDFKNTFGNNPTEKEKAWWRKRISCGEITTEKALLSAMSYTKSKKVRIGSPFICGLKPESSTSASSSSSGATVIKRGVEGIGANPTIRIGIYSAGDGKGAVKVTANGAYQVRVGSETIGKLDDSNTVSVTYTGGKYHVRGSGLSNDSDEPVRFIPGNSNTIMQITSFNDKSKATGKNYNRFRGIVDVMYDKDHKELWAVNELKVELYVRGLGETSGTGPEDYLKSLGIAARTYALYHKVVTGGRRDIFDIGSTADDQIYRGYEFEILTPRFSSILNETAGVILTNGDGDKPIASVYFSDSDGHTRSAKEVWNSSRFSYLQSVADPHHASKSCLGHCVGMSAQGAFGFAKADGWDYKKILTYYFKGVQLVKAY